MIIFRSKSSLTVTPIISICQLYSNHSVELIFFFFVRLYHELGSINSINVLFNDAGNIIIRYRGVRVSKIFLCHTLL